MGSEKFCLRWNDFESNISAAFRELRDDKDFFDVTLACDDEQIQAHKVILSACSPFFRNVLRQNPHQHPLLYLKGVRYTDLQSVLNFMYHGEVNVAQEELNTFLAVAEDLKVKGLTQNNSSEKEKKSERYSQPAKSLKPAPRPPDRDSLPIQKRPRPAAPSNPSPILSTLSHTDDYDDIQEVVPVKTEPRDSIPPPQPMPQQHPSPMVPISQEMYNPVPSRELTPAPEDHQLAYQEENYEDYSQYEVEQEYEGGMGAEGMNKGSGQELLYQANTDDGKLAWRCSLCGKDFFHKSSGTRHVETMHYESPSQECEVCGKVLKNKNSYQNHIAITHGIKKRGGK